MLNFLCKMFGHKYIEIDMPKHKKYLMYLKFKGIPFKCVRCSKLKFKKYVKT